MRWRLSENVMRPAIYTLAAFLLLAGSARADCVVGAQMAARIVILNSNTIVLQTASGGILIKTYHYFFGRPSLTVLKDSFCDFDSAVLYVDGEVVDAQSVKRVA